MLEALDSCFRRNDGMGFRNVRENIREGWFDKLTTNGEGRLTAGGSTDMVWVDGMMREIARGIGVGGVREFLIPHCVRNDREGAFGTTEGRGVRDGR